MKASLTCKESHIHQQTFFGWLNSKKQIEYRCVSLPQKTINKVFNVE